MTKVVVDVDADMVDALFVEYLKKQVANIEEYFNTCWHSDDKMMYIQVHAACLTLLQWMLIYGDFQKFMDQQYGRKPD